MLLYSCNVDMGKAALLPSKRTLKHEIAGDCCRGHDISFSLIYDVLRPKSGGTSKLELGHRGELALCHPVPATKLNH